MRKSEKKGPSFWGTLLPILRLTFLELSCNFRKFGIKKNMGIFFDLTSLRDPRVLAGPLSTRILLGDVCPPCTWLYSLLFVDINCSYLMVLAITIGNICPYYFMTFALLLDDICEHCRIFKYVACRRPSEFHQSKRVVPRCGQILVFGLSHAASQPRSRSGQRTQSFHHSYWSMFNVQCLIFIAHCSMFVIQCTVFKVLCLVFDALCSILKIRPTHTINPSLTLYHTL